MLFGYMGKILQVNLTSGEISVETPSEQFYRTHFGGRAIIAYYLLKRLEAGIDPLSPKNLLIFATGVLTGTTPSGSGRNSVGAKSPLTGGFGDAEVGGWWGSELKKAGYDAIVVSGRADNPEYLWMNDDHVELRDASHIWGTSTAEAEHVLKKELNESNLRVCQIGPAGEKLVRYACVVNDLSHFAGRCGLGAVMGSKNLRAIAVRGHHSVQVSKPQELLALAKWKSANMQTPHSGGRPLKTLRDLGTAAGVLALNAGNGLPTRNFSDGVFEHAENISGERMRDTILVRRDTCYACAVICKRVVKLETPYSVDAIYGGPEYETLAAFGSNCGIGDLEALAKASEICAANGLDSISTGNAIAFGMECAERGLIPREMDAVRIEFGSSKSMLGILDLIIKRKGIGKILGEGVKRAAEQLGEGTSDFAMHVKGQEIPMHEPRIKHALGLGYAVSPTGADHMHNVHDTGYTKETENLKDLAAFGILEPLPATDLGPAKVRLFKYASLWKHFYNCAVLCMFLNYTVAQLVEFVNATTSWNTSSWELMKVAERAVNMTRIFNLREGFTSKDDSLPSRFYEQFKNSQMQSNLNEKTLEEAKKLYYEMMGWSETGVPRLATLYELDLGWLASTLPKISQ